MPLRSTQIDPRCLELATSYLTDKPLLVDRVNDLAVFIEDAVDEWIEEAEDEFDDKEDDDGA